MKERIKELREWGTFLLTAMTVIAIPIGALVLRDQRLQIEKAAAEQYVAKGVFADFQTATNRKLETIDEKVSQIREDIAAIKGRGEHSSKN